MKGRTEAPGHWKILRRRSSPGQVTGAMRLPLQIDGFRPSFWLKLTVRRTFPRLQSPPGVVPGSGACDIFRTTVAPCRIGVYACL